MNDIPAHALDCLRRAGHPLTVHQLTRCVRRSRKCAGYEVLRELRGLLAEGKVVTFRGLWRLPEDGNRKSEDNPRGIRESSNVRPQVSAETASLLWGGAPGASPQPPNENQPHQDDIPPVSTSRTWTHFRKLLAYYQECVRNEEGANAVAYTEKLGKTFFYLQRSGPWQPRPGLAWQTTIPLDGQLAEFVAALPAAGDDTALVLGYPVSAVYREQTQGPPISLLRPIFYYPLGYGVDAQGLVLRTVESYPEINLGWLEYGFARKADRQRNFLAACGFVRSRVLEDGLPGLERNEARPGLDSLAAAVAAFLPREIREPLNIANLVTAPLTEPFATGIYNRAVVMLAKRTRYNATLLRELAAIARASDAELNRTALRHVFYSVPSSTSASPDETQQPQRPPDEALAADVHPFNPAQRQAVAELLTAGLTVITGPPGTGKSQVVAGCAANARLQGQSVLISSRNHKAIDAVACRMVDANNTPLLVRANSKEDPSLRVTFGTTIKQMLTSQASPAARTKIHTERQDLLNRLAERGKAALEARERGACAASLGEAEEKLQHLAAALAEETTTHLDEFPDACPGELIQALRSGFFSDHALMVTDQPQEPAPQRDTPQTRQAVSVQPPWSLLRFALLYFRLRRALTRIPGLLKLPFWPTRHARELLARRLPVLIMAEEYARYRCIVRETEARIRNLPPLEQSTADLARITQRLDQILPGLLTLDLESRLGLPPGVDRTALSGLRSALRVVQTGLHDQATDVSTQKDLLHRGAPAVLQAFPVWAVTCLSVGSRLPFCPGLFDLALLDEASQSDIASAIPVLFRARRVGVIGDPLQLTHTSSLSPSRDTLLWRKLCLSEVEDYRFAYTHNSLYDLCAGVRGVEPILLNVTYRGSEPIAQYSNHLFYGGRLQVATDPERLNPPPGMKPGLHWTEVAGEVRSAGGSGCHCPQEVEAVVDLVRLMLEQNAFRGSVGVVTPFRQQANRIQDALFDGRIRHEALRDAQVHVDTAHGFQGDERDVILFSLCAGADMPAGSRAFLRETGNLFNVAVSRARAVLHVIGNRQWAAACGIPHIQRLTTGDRPPPPPPPGRWTPHESPWEKILFDALVQAGLQPKAQYPVRFRRLDMALIREGVPPLKLDIEVDGDCHRNPDGTRKLDDHWRDVELMGRGWRVVRFWTYQLKEDLPGCVQHIRNIWEQP